VWEGREGEGVGGKVGERWGKGGGGVEGRGGWDGLFEFGGGGAVFERYLKGRLVVVLGRGWERGKVRCREAFWVVKWEWGGWSGGDENGVGSGRDEGV